MNRNQSLGTRKTSTPAVAYLGVLMAALLAGCVGGPDTAPGTSASLQPPGDADAPGQPTWSQDISGADCTTTFLAYITELARFDAWLPPGYVAGDAGQVFTFPALVGKGFAGVSVVSCPVNAFTGTAIFDASISIHVKPPVLPDTDHEFEPGSTDFYHVEHFANDPAWTDLLRSAGLPVTNATASISPDEALVAGAYGLGGAASAVEDANGTLWQSAVAGATWYPTGDWHTRYWHDAENGTTVMERAWDAPAVLGAPACTIREGSTLARLLGNTLCSPDEDSFLVQALFSSTDLQATLTFLPEVHAQ